MERKSKDLVKKHLKKLGNKLLEVLNANKMIVLNGLEDEGENTFFISKKGETMIDFIIINYEMYCNEAEDEDIDEYIRKKRQKSTK